MPSALANDTTVYSPAGTPLSRVIESVKRSPKAVISRRNTPAGSNSREAVCPTSSCVVLFPFLSVYRYSTTRVGLGLISMSVSSFSEQPHTINPNRGIISIFFIV